jgi:hypothetical protein
LQGDLDFGEDDEYETTEDVTANKKMSTKKVSWMKLGVVLADGT